MASSARTSIQRNSGARVFYGVFYNEIQADGLTSTPLTERVARTNYTVHLGTFAILPNRQYSNTPQQQQNDSSKTYYQLVPGASELTNPGVVGFNKSVAFFSVSKIKITPNNVGR